MEPPGGESSRGRRPAHPRRRETTPRPGPLMLTAAGRRVPSRARPRSPSRSSRRRPAPQPAEHGRGERVAQATRLPPPACPRQTPVIGWRPDGPAPSRVPPSRPHLSAPVGAAPPRGRVPLVLPDSRRCPRVSRPATQFQLPAFLALPRRPLWGHPGR